MKKIFTVFLSLFFVVVFEGNAQNIRTAKIQWNAERIFNATQGQWAEQATYLITYGSDRAEWFNSDGSLRGVFKASDVIGDWLNINLEGIVQYEISNGQSRGTITIRKQGGDTKILISLDAESSTLQEITIVNTQVL